MNKTLLKITISLCTGLIIFTACKKESKQPEETPTPSGPPPVFNWKVNSTSFSSDSTFCYPGFSSIHAFKGGTANTIDITLSSLGTGTYNISSASGILLDLNYNNTSYSATSGKVIITASTGTNISGNVTAAFSGTAITSFSGDFIDVPKRN